MDDGAPRRPFEGVRVVELAGLAPGPFAGLLLADYGASVLRVDRPHPLAHSSSSSSSSPSPPAATGDYLTRNKASIALDLKSPGGLLLLRSLLKTTDVLIDPYRPGVLESLGLAPEDLLAANQRLVIARLTGFRRTGKYATMAGHDINYIAVAGVLSHLGRKGQPPCPPVNLLADFAGGGLMCAFGIAMALLSRAGTGKGQVVESNMVDGAAYLATFLRLARSTSLSDRPRGENILDGGCPWYDVYECKDGGYMAVGALEPQFFAVLIDRLGLGKELNEERYDRDTWPRLRESFEETFKTKTRMEWERVFDGTDACCTPVLTQSELEEAGYDQRPAVGLTATPSREIDPDTAWKPAGLAPGEGGEHVLRQWMGWRRGKDYEVVKGALVKSPSAKL